VVTGIPRKHTQGYLLFSAEIKNEFLKINKNKIKLSKNYKKITGCSLKHPKTFSVQIYQKSQILFSPKISENSK